MRSCNITSKLLEWCCVWTQKEDFRSLHTESEILVWNFRMLKNKYNLTLCQSHLHSASETFIHDKKINKFGSGKMLCVFTSVASILIGKDDEPGKHSVNGLTGLSMYKFSKRWCKTCSPVPSRAIEIQNSNIFFVQFTGITAWKGRLCEVIQHINLLNNC